MSTQLKIEKELLYSVIRLTDTDNDLDKLKQIETIRILLKNLENKITDKNMQPYKSNVLDK